MRKIYTPLLFVLSISLAAQSSYLEGFIYESHGSEELLFATVKLYQNNELAKGTTTDFDGQFKFQDIIPGDYFLEASYVGYETKRKKIKIKEGKNTGFLGLKYDPVVLVECVIYAYKPPVGTCCKWTCGGIVVIDGAKNEEEIYKGEPIEHRSFLKDEYKVFPNPAQGFTTIDIVENLNSISIYNSSSQMVFGKINPEAGNLQIDVSSWNTGMYAIVFEKEGEVVTQKLVVVN